MDGNIAVDGIAEYTPSQLERLAGEFLRERVDVPHGLPVNVELLVDNIPGVLLITLENLRTRHSVEGCICNVFMPRRTDIYVDQSIADGSSDAKYNAVVGEELAHLVLHRGLINQVEDVDDFIALRQHPTWHRIERDAQYFSGAIRMPPDALEEVAKAGYREAVYNHGFSNCENMVQHIRNYVAAQFVVPMLDAKRRLSQCARLRLISRIEESVVIRSSELLSISTLDAPKRDQPLYLFDP